MNTQEIIERLTLHGKQFPLSATFYKIAADRLCELQFLIECEEIHSKDWEDQAREARKERDEAGDEVKRLKISRPEPSRLEIAAMLKAGWFANSDCDFDSVGDAWWIEQADALIAAAQKYK